MAGSSFSVDSGDITLTPGTNDPLTLVQIVPLTNHRVLIKEVRVFASLTTAGGTPANETALVTLCHQSTVSSGASALTAVKVNQEDDISAQSTVQKLSGGAANEPSTNNVVIADRMYPALGGGFVWQALRREDMIPVKGGSAFGVRVDADYATTTRPYRAVVVFEE